VLLARDIADLGFPDLTLEDLRDEWGADDFDLDADAVVAENDDGRICGYAVIQGPGALAAVDPGAEDRGIGTLLLRWTERRDRALGRSRHRQAVVVANERAQSLLLDAGYRRERSYSRLVRELDQGVLAGPLPAAVSLRPFAAAGDAAALHAVDDASFSAVPDYRPHSLDEFHREHLAVHDFAPELSLVAERGSDIAGFLLARRWEQEGVGYVDLLAVHPDEQGRGLGTAMLTTAFERFVAAGLREAQLAVASDNPKALRIYQRVGMVELFRLDAFERPVKED
jgi:mycothiol synthase